MLGSDAIAASQIEAEKSSSGTSRWRASLATGLIILAAIAVYHNCFSVPFLLDDFGAIIENPTIRHLWPIRDALSPPHGKGLTVEGRPVVNLSLAVNYAFGGTTLRGYHALNLTIHILAALALFGIVRRTLLQPSLRERFGASATPLGFAVALLWTVHPLATEPVLYVVQRAESLMGLFYLLMIYGVIRCAESPAPTKWYAFPVAACLLGMATKEVMVSAPLMALLYDRTFLAGSFREAWRKRWPLYAGLAGTWLVLGYLVFTTGTRGGTVGFQTTVGPWDYALTQAWAMVHYLRLSVWPHPLVFDYGTYLVTTAAAVLPAVLILAVLVSGTAIGLWRRLSIGFLGAWFFLILAPSSSVVPVATQAVAEHRMYLPLMTVVALVVLGIHRLMGRLRLSVFLTLAVGLGFVTLLRNHDYRSARALWSDTVTKLPNNARAHNNLGASLVEEGRVPEAIPRYEQALRLMPDYADAHCNLGIALASFDRFPEAIAHFEQTVRLDPKCAKAQNNLGVLLQKTGRLPEAMEHYEAALRAKPDYTQTHYNLGNLLLQAGRLPEAMQHYQEAIRLKPDYAAAHYGAGIVLFLGGKTGEAKAQFEQALQIRPDYAEAQNNLGTVFLNEGRLTEAMQHYEEAVRINPRYARAHNNLGRTLAQAGRTQEAKAQYEEALRLQPDYEEARINLMALQSPLPSTEAIK